ncbi:hypothetical protein AB6A40_005758 [Gnathostoma spinigerum]|uniref:Cell cycle checkpoint protein RAD17 n=1 Tax=Gnathostoma spinigerum TaxID=75299 RepID=A0ABD6EGD4_9BILA
MCDEWFSSPFSATPTDASDRFSRKRSVTDKCGSVRKKSKEVNQKMLNDVVAEESEDVDIIYVCKDVELSSDKEANGGIGMSDKNQCFLPLIDRCPPTCTSDLAVHKKKIEEVRFWLKSHCKRSNAKVLLMTGPCGSGKTVTLKLLCEEMNIGIVEWTAPDKYDISVAENGSEIIAEQPQLNSFTEFLDSAKYGRFHAAKERNIILVENLPNILYLQPEQLHLVLRRCMSRLLSSIVFVISSVESSWYLNIRRILPIHVINDLGIDVITFNSPSVTLLIKCVQLMLKKLKLKAEKTKIKRIAESADGDIRCAVNNLQLSIDENRSLVNDVKLCSSSSQTDVFHSLGKLLYAKRLESADRSWTETENLLSKNLLQYRRDCPPKSYVDDIISRSGLSSDQMMSFLQEHEVYFLGVISDCRRVFYNISLMDCTFNSWQLRESPYVDEYEAQVSARSTLFFNSSTRPNFGRSLYKFHKPRWSNEWKQYNVIAYECRVAFPFVPSTDLFTLLLPMLSYLSVSLDNRQRLALTSLGRWVLSDRRIAAKMEETKVLTDSKERTTVAMKEDHFDIEEVDDCEK